MSQKWQTERVQPSVDWPVSCVPALSCCALAAPYDQLTGAVAARWDGLLWDSLSVFAGLLCAVDVGRGALCPAACNLCFCNSSMYAIGDRVEPSPGVGEGDGR